MAAENSLAARAVLNWLQSQQEPAYGAPAFQAGGFGGYGSGL